MAHGALHDSVQSNFADTSAKDVTQAVDRKLSSQVLEVGGFKSGRILRNGAK